MGKRFILNFIIPSKGDCFENTPYASLIGFVLILSGCGLMCGSNFEALRRTSNVFEDHFYPIQWPAMMKFIGISVSVITTIFAVFNLSIGMVTTGSRRRKLFSHNVTQLKGQRVSTTLLLLTYLFTTVWLLAFVAFSMAVSLWSMLHTVCREETDYWRALSADKSDPTETEFTYILNLTTYGVYRRPLDTSLYSETINSPSAFTHLCQELSTVGPLFAIGLIASFLVVLGLTVEVACLSNSIVQLEYSPELDRYRRLVASQGDPAAELHHNVSVAGPPARGLEEYSLQPLLGHPAPPPPPLSLTSGSLQPSVCLHHHHIGVNPYADFSQQQASAYGSLRLAAAAAGGGLNDGSGRFVTSSPFGPLGSLPKSQLGLSQSSLHQPQSAQCYHQLGHRSGGTVASQNPGSIQE